MSEATEPVKLCECGCGQPTKISKYTDCRTGAVRGQPNRFIRGHSSKVAETFQRGRQRANEEREAAVLERRETVKEAFLLGVPLWHIADELGVAVEIVARDVGHMRENGVDLPYRCIPTSEYVDEELADEIASTWSDEEASTVAIAKKYGWPRVKAQTVIAALRRAGYRIDPRNAVPLELSPEEKRAVARAFKKSVRQSVDLSQKQRVILRLLQAAKRPLAVRELAILSAAAGAGMGTTNLQSWLRYMERRELIAHVEVPHTRRMGKNRWFVPLGAEQPAANLTLADAERETELAALIESQQDELQRGEWIDSEKGHWADRSIDAPLTADGFTILDTLGEEDEALDELVGGVA